MPHGAFTICFQTGLKKLTGGLSMVFKLVEGERIVRSCNYARSKSKSTGITDNNLTITNKRIIVTKEGDRYIEKQEIPLSKVRSFSGLFRTNNLKGMIITMASILAAFVILMLWIAGFDEIKVILEIALVYSAICAIYLWRASKACYFSLNFEFYPANDFPTSLDEVTFGDTCNGFTVPKAKRGILRKLFHRRPLKSLRQKVYIDRRIAREFVEEINGVLMELNEQ